MIWFLIFSVWSSFDTNCDLDFEYDFIYILLSLVFSLILKITNSKKRKVKDVGFQPHLKCIEFKTAPTSTYEIKACGDNAKTNPETEDCNKHNFGNFNSYYLSRPSTFLQIKDFQRSYSDTCLSINNGTLTPVQTTTTSKSKDTYIEEARTDTPFELYSELTDIDRAWFEMEEQELIDIFEKTCFNNSPVGPNKPFNNPPVPVNPPELSYEVETLLEKLEHITENSITLSPVQTKDAFKSNISIEIITTEYSLTSYCELSGIDNPVFQLEKEEESDFFQNPCSSNNPFAESLSNNPFNKSSVLVNRSELSYEIETAFGKLARNNIEDDNELSQSQTPDALKSNHASIQKIASAYSANSICEPSGIDSPIFDLEEEEEIDTLQNACLSNNRHFPEEFFISSYNDSEWLLDNKGGKRRKFKSIGKVWKKITRPTTSQKYMEMKYWMQKNGKKMKNFF